MPALARALKADDPLLRVNAVYVLSGIGTAATVAPRIQALSDNSARVRALAVRWLPVWSDDKARSAALGVLKDADPYLRREAAGAFSPRRVDNFKAANWEINKPAEAILPLLEDPDTREAAADVLGDLGSNCAARPLVKALADDRSLVRAACVEAIGKLRDKQVTAGVLPMLQDPEASVRRTAATALGELADLRATPALVGALSDPKYYVRRDAAVALGQIGDRRAVEPLIKALDDPEEHVRSTAALSLGQIGDPRAVEPLSRLLKPKHRQARSAARALGQLGDPRAIEPLTRYLMEESKSKIAGFSDALADAAEALARIRHPDAVVALVQVATDGNSFEARRTLGKLVGASFGGGAKDVESWWRANRVLYLPDVPAQGKEAEEKH